MAKPIRSRLTGYRFVAEKSPTDIVAEHLARKSMRSPKNVAEVMFPLAAMETGEVFWLLALDTQHHLIGGAPIVVTRGTLNSSLVHAREIFKRAFAADGCAAIILAHNHPSGDPTPSSDDRLITTQLVAAGKLLDVPVIDHVIVGAGKYTSFAEAGLL